MLLISVLHIIFIERPEADPDNDMVPHALAKESFHFPQHLLKRGIQSHVSAFHYQEKSVGGFDGL
jgi:hypothetical protein